jgi:hypothetical protein
MNDEKKGLSNGAIVGIAVLVVFGLLGSLMGEEEKKEAPQKDRCTFKTARVELYGSGGDQLLGQDVVGCIRVKTSGLTNIVDDRGRFRLTYDGKELTSATDSYLQTLTMQVQGQPAETIRASDGAVIKMNLNTDGMVFRFTYKGQRGTVTYSH